MKRCLFALLLLSLSRIFFIIYLYPYFSNAPLAQLPLVFLAGILFDIQALVYALGVFHLLSLLPFAFTNAKWYRILLKVLFVLGLSTILLLNFIDTEFYTIKTRRSGMELFAMVSDPANSPAQYLLHYWWLLLIFIASVFAITRFYPKSKGNQVFIKPIPTIGLTLFVFVLLFIGARGGFYKKPVRSFDAARFVDAKWVSATINSPTQLLTSFNAMVPVRVEFMTDAEALAIFNPHQTVSPYFKSKQHPNVVIIILESFGRDYCGFLNKGSPYTPFLDSLSKSSISFSNAYSAGTTSMESVPAIFTSLPSLLEVPFINSNFQNNTLHGIHYYLNNMGYDCSFYYGADNGSMGFDNYLKINGPIQYFGLNEYPSKESDHDGSWGIWDEPYLQYYANELSKKKAPFFSSVFTLTSHDPYKIPKEYQKQFKGGKLPIHKSVQYTDYALSQFFEKAKMMSWFDNTIFVITADHPSHSTNEYFYTPIGKYEIPLLIYSPKYFPVHTDQIQTVSQCDIMPSVLSFAGYKGNIFSFGQHLLDTTKATVINRESGITQLIQYPYCIQLLPNDHIAMHFQDKQTPNKLTRYILDPAEKELETKLAKELKAKQQIYINSLLDNRFFAD